MDERLVQLDTHPPTVCSHRRTRSRTAALPRGSARKRSPAAPDRRRLSPDRPTRSAARNETSPGPHPTSRTLIPGSIPASTKKRRVMFDELRLSDEAIDLTLRMPQDVSSLGQMSPVFMTYFAGSASSDMTSLSRRRAIIVRPNSFEIPSGCRILSGRKSSSRSCGSLPRAAFPTGDRPSGASVLLEMPTTERPPCDPKGIGGS